jgi:hypothetical protein
MKRMLAVICLFLLSAGSAHPDPSPCLSKGCALEVRIASVAEAKVYGLLLAAPRTGCRRVRYRVETASLRLLGKTPALRAGEMAVVRIGAGYAEGEHTLFVSAEGCASVPQLSRRVTLRKASPDHGWRAARATVISDRGN